MVDVNGVGKKSLEIIQEGGYKPQGTTKSSKDIQLFPNELLPSDGADYGCEFERTKKEYGAKDLKEDLNSQYKTFGRLSLLKQAEAKRTAHDALEQAKNICDLYNNTHDVKLTPDYKSFPMPADYAKEGNNRQELQQWMLDVKSWVADLKMKALVNTSAVLEGIDNGLRNNTSLIEDQIAETRDGFDDVLEKVGGVDQEVRNLDSKLEEGIDKINENIDKEGRKTRGAVHGAAKGVKENSDRNRVALEQSVEKNARETQVLNGIVASIQSRLGDANDNRTDSTKSSIEVLQNKILESKYLSFDQKHEYLSKILGLCDKVIISEERDIKPINDAVIKAEKDNGWNPPNFRLGVPVQNEDIRPPFLP